MGNGATIIFKRAWLEDCLKRDGYIYNESFRVGEDQELIWRMRRRGLKVVYVPVKTIHLRTTTMLGYLRYQFNRGIGIAHLYRAQRQAGPGAAFQPSLIWGQADASPVRKWLKALLLKAFGPFDRAHFSCAKYFWTHWMAEKFQGFGFLWGLVTR